MTHGPVDFIVLSFEGNHFSGEIIPTIEELVDKKIISIIDLIIVMKDKEGVISALELEQLAPEVMAIFDPLEVHISGMITLEDIKFVGETLQNNSTAAFMLFENLWAIKFKEAALRANGALVLHGRVPANVIDEALAVVVD
jgi:uncharacterized membrane protein